MDGNCQQNNTLHLGKAKVNEQVRFRFIVSLYAPG